MHAIELKYEKKVNTMSNNSFQILSTSTMSSVSTNSFNSSFIKKNENKEIKPPKIREKQNERYDQILSRLQSNEEARLFKANDMKLKEMNSIENFRKKELHRLNVLDEAKRLENEKLLEIEKRILNKNESKFSLTQQERNKLKSDYSVVIKEFMKEYRIKNKQKMFDKSKNNLEESNVKKKIDESKKILNPESN